MSIDEVDLSVEWSALLDGSIVAEIDLLQPTVNFVSAPTKKQSQTEPSSNWTEVVSDLVPFSINRFSIADGEIHYRDFNSKPKVDIYVQKLNTVTRNLTNSQDLAGSLVASFEGSAMPMGSGGLKFEGKVDKARESLPNKLWQGLADAVGELLEDQRTDRIATLIPFEGRLEDPNADVWSTLGGLLKNAFTEALRRGLEGRIELSDASSSKD